ncbi:hypothetical protein VTK73DRAFT_6906 [Phialemonium thermophilum]|uniref:Uncharacterized protein n=1 Tax=Phialemonium thermophilum TaxID=223376 RepID=A0ABR3WHQ1_9PEZI
MLENTRVGCENWHKDVVCELRHAAVTVFDRVYSFNESTVLSWSPSSRNVGDVSWKRYLKRNQVSTKGKVGQMEIRSP